ncbi:MAG: archaellin/type IV pilin N-terminal domain-containing protein [Nanoarchaeota archaeon]
MMRSRRGISPLIATVLLIGFAVALGVMIMSITSNVIADSCDEMQFNTEQLCFESGLVYPYVVLEDQKIEKCTKFRIDPAALPACSR